VHSRAAASLLILLVVGAGVLAVTAFADLGSSRRKPIRNDGTFRITAVPSQGMSLDPALPSAALGSLIEATCARLMRYPDKPPPKGYTLMPEVAKRYPKSSNGGKTFSFELRHDFRFNNGEPVRADAFERQMIRLLELEDYGAYGATLIRNIVVGANRIQNGPVEAMRHIEGIRAHGYRLVIRLNRPVPDFPDRLASPWFCAVPPDLPADRQGASLRFAGSGPYYVAENVPGRRIVLERNKKYSGTRPHHVDRFVVDGNASDASDALDRVAQGRADWGWASPNRFFEPKRRLIERYGTNKSQFWLKEGLNFNHYSFNTARGLFQNNASLRRAVNFAINRRALRAAGGPLTGRLTDQYLPPQLQSFRDAHIYPLNRADVRTARKLAAGHTGSGRVSLYVPDILTLRAGAQVIKQELKSIRLTVEIKSFPFPVYVAHVLDTAEPWDLAWSSWGPDYLDPSTYLNSLLDGKSVSNWGHFDSSRYNRKLRRAALLQGEAREREYGRLDVELARDAAPLLALSYGNAPTLVSKNVDPRCIVLRPDLDLTAVCLK